MDSNCFILVFAKDKQERERDRQGGRGREKERENNRQGEKEKETGREEGGREGGREECKKLFVVHQLQCLFQRVGDGECLTNHILNVRVLQKTYFTIFTHCFAKL